MWNNFCDKDNHRQSKPDCKCWRSINGYLPKWYKHGDGRQCWRGSDRRNMDSQWRRFNHKCHQPIDSNLYR